MLKDKIKEKNFKRDHILFRNEKEHHDRDINHWKMDYKMKSYDFEKILMFDNQMKDFVFQIDEYCRKQLEFWEEIFKD